MSELTFVNSDATPKTVTIKTRKTDIPAIMRWYGAFYAGDRYRVLIDGKPVKKDISTSYVERSNLSLRMHNRRFTRLTNAFSKKFENHVHMISLYTVFYNFVRIHKSLKVTPAMAAGVTDELLEMADIVNLIDKAAPAPGRPRKYKKQSKNS